MPDHSLSAASTSVTHHDEAVDALLERYLHLLDEYTCLRQDLNKLQSSMYQQLARANFAPAERGIWYGQDYYDDRMRASRTISITSDIAPTASASNPSSTGTGTTKRGGEGTARPRFSILRETPPSKEKEKDQEESDEDKGQAIKDTSGLPSSSTDSVKEEPRDEATNAAEPSPSAVSKKQQQQPVVRDPLRWFGLLTPMALREAQACGIRAVEEIVPRLATVAAEMAEVEIEVRRARKKRAKAAAAAASAISPSKNMDPVSASAATDDLQNFVTA